MRTDDMTSDKRFRTSEVSMILGRRWGLPGGRDLLAQVSDDLNREMTEVGGFAKRGEGQFHRRWTADEVELIALVLRLRRAGDDLKRRAVELVGSSDRGGIEQLLAVLDDLDCLPSDEVAA